MKNVWIRNLWKKGGDSTWFTPSKDMDIDPWGISIGMMLGSSQGPAWELQCSLKITWFGGVVPLSHHLWWGHHEVWVPFTQTNDPHKVVPGPQLARSSCCHSSWGRSEFCRPRTRPFVDGGAACLEWRCMMRPSYDQRSKLDTSSLCKGWSIGVSILDCDKPQYIG